MNKLIRVLALSLLLGACHSNSKEVTVKTDQFTQEVQLSSEKFSAHPLRLMGENIAWTWQLQSFIDKKTAATRYQVAAQFIYYTNLKYMKSASDDTAQHLKVIQVYHVGSSCMSGGCKRLEKIAIIVNESDLQKHATTGYSIKVTARSGDFYRLDITADAIEKLLATTAQYAAHIKESASN
jgi:hypothetical protein